MNADFQRDYLLRLPLPLAQLYSRAFNAKDARARHDNAFYLCEVLVKLAAAPAVACYLHEANRGRQRSDAIDRLLIQLALPSFGQWLAILRELSRYFGVAADASRHPLGRLHEQLVQQRTDRPALLALFQRIKNGPDGAAAGDQRCSAMQVLDALVQYRNLVFGHGGPRFDSFFEKEMGPLLFPAINELLADDSVAWFGPAGSRFVYLTEIRTLDAESVEVGLRELTGHVSERMTPRRFTADQARALLPNRVAMQWPGWTTPLRLDPLLVYRETDQGEDLLLLNRDRNSRQVEYLSYFSGRTERDASMAPALTALLSAVTGRTVTEQQLADFQSQSMAETPSVEALAGEMPMSGRVLGDYEVLGELGRGGMGVVYLARQLSLGRLVALKTLPADVTGDEVALARLRREMRALSRCDHPHIVKVLASGTLPEGEPFYTMEYVPGCDLEHAWRELSADGGGKASDLSGISWQRAVLSASRKQRAEIRNRGLNSSLARPALEPPAPRQPELPLQPLPESPLADEDPGGYVRRVVALVRDAARAVQAVHDQDLIHRDIKPANLMLSPDGQRVVLMDFGLAKARTTSRTLSVGGGLLGTLRYSAPEQLAAANVKVGREVDVRGLGVTLWELLTRRRLFAEAQDEAQLSQMILGRDVPKLRSVDSTFDRDLEAIVARASERAATDRIASAAQMADYLQMWLDGQSLPIRSPGLGELLRRWVRQHKPLVASATAALVVVVVAVVISFVQISTALANEKSARQNEQSARELAERHYQQARKAVDRYYTEVSENVLLHEPGMDPLRKKLLEGAREFYESFLNERGRDPAARADLGGAIFRLAQITGDVTSKTEAIQLFQRAADVFAELVAEQPDSVAFRGDLADCDYQLGRLYRRTDQLPLAEERYRKALAEWTELEKAAPQDFRCRAGLARSQFGLGNLLQVLRRHDEAVGAYVEALKLRQAIADEDRDVKNQRDLALTHHNLARTQLTLGHVKEAETEFLECLKVQQRMHDGNPSVKQYSNDLARTYFNLGDLYSSELRSIDAVGAYQKAIDIWKELIDRNPAVNDYRLHLADAYLGQADAFRATRNWDAVKRLYSELMKVIENLAKNDPNQQRDQWYLGRAFYSKGVSYAQMGETATARDAFRDARRIQEALLSAAPSVHHYRSDLAGTVYELGRLLVTTDDQEGANEALMAALKNWQALAKVSPADAEFTQRLCDCLMMLGDRARASRQWQSALEWFSRAITVLDNAAAPMRGQLWYQNLRPAARVRRARVLMELGRRDESLADWDLAVGVAPVAQRLFFAIFRAQATAKAGKHVLAAALAKELEDRTASSGDLSFRLAYVYAACLEASAADAQLTADQKRELAEDYSAAALTALQRARDAGYFTTPARRAMLDSDPNLAPLRGLAAFKELREKILADKTGKDDRK
jgi:eukaryotic-like serine/threonine-protein kinase